LPKPPSVDETDLIGNWIIDSGTAKADEVESRINGLTAHYMKKIAVSPASGAWETLYQDPIDGRYWELSYPTGDMHGGGPKRLSVISPAAAATKYGLQP